MSKLSIKEFDQDRSEIARELSGRESICSLCRADQISFRYHDDPVCWAAINPTSNVPMVVLKEHRKVPRPEDQQHMLRVLEHIMGAHGHPIGSYTVSDPNSIPDHYHIQGGKNEGLKF